MINFSKIPKNLLIGRFLRFLLKMVPNGITIPILQGPMRGIRWIVGSGVHGYWLGTYEVEKQKLFKKIVKPGDVVFDIGANVGFYALLASQLVGPSGKVIAFEPLNKNVSYIRRHIKINNLDNVSIIEAAVADKGGIGFLIRGTDRFTGHLDSNSNKEGLRVKTISLDEGVETGLIPMPDVLKIDVEGGEYNALKGAENIIKTKKPSVIIAIHGNNMRYKCITLLQGFGYNVSSLTHGKVLNNDIEFYAK